MPKRLTSFRAYYLRVLKRTFEDLWSFGRQQVIIAVLSSLVILYLQLRWGLTAKDLTFYGYMSIALPYLGIIAAAFIVHAIRAPWILDKDRQRRATTLRRRLRKQRREVEALGGELEAIKAYKVVAEIVHVSSCVYADVRHIKFDCPVIHVEITLRFKNRAPHDIAIEDLDVVFCERTDDNKVFEMAALGSRPRTLRHRRRDGGIQHVDITGLTVKGYSLSPEYVFVWESMALVDEPHLTPTNGQHFLRLTVRTVLPQKPYVVDIGVDWENPASYIWSKGPVDD